MYDYENEKKYVFTDEGQRKFLEIRDTIHVHLKNAGAFAMGKVANRWKHMACVDRLVELGEIKEIPRGSDCPGQYRIFVKPRE